jgi:taurine dioxygenase
MALQLSRLGPHMGIAAEGVDLAAPPDAATAAALLRALLDGLVLCIRGRPLAPDVYVAAMRGFGAPRSQLGLHRRHPAQAEIMILSSEDRDEKGDGRRIVVGAAWHSDDSFMAEPCSLTILHGVQVPETGGDTQFTNMYAAYDALDDATRTRIAPLRVVHRYDSSRKGNRITTRTAEEVAKTPEVDHPLVRTHPETGRKALYMNPNRMELVVGMARAESDRLLDDLIAHATEPRFQYRHQWRPGDILIWDNRCTMHKANADYPEGSRREMHRLIIEGTRPV